MDNHSHSVSVVQMQSGTTCSVNLDHARHFIEQAAKQGAKLILLPECFGLMAQDAASVIQAGEPLGEGLMQEHIARCARDYKVWIIAGTIPIISPVINRVYAGCTVWDDQGQLAAHYYKMHLFDVTHPAVYQESNTYLPGDQLVVVETPVGKVGLTVCYDLRFPEMYRALREKGAEWFAVPAAFTEKTGAAHWEVLLRARAIENQCYVLAANQQGLHEHGRRTYGHSMVIDDWGRVLVQQQKHAGVLLAEMNIDVLHQRRQDFPTWQHRKDSYEHQH